MTAESGKWEKKNNPTVTIDSEGTTITTSTSGEKSYRMKNISFSLPYTIEFDWVSGGGSQKYGLQIWDDSVTTCMWYAGHWDDVNIDKYVLFTFPSSSSSNKTEAKITRSINSGDHIMHKVIEGNITLFVNGEQVLTKTQGKDTNPTRVMEFYTNKDRLQKIKNVKVKNYSE
ncbi:hypothetical protein [Methanobrevibacter intestini]|uniref:hypothetical protein n=1 Tax=Methanobrevibacter intestini TaxID=2911853 RepID=UPI003D064E5F